MARRPSAHLWPSRPWNSDTGRVVDWIKRWQRSGSYASRRAVLAFWQIAVKDTGEVATRAAVKAAGLTLPDFLTETAPIAAQAASQRPPKAA